MPRNKNPKFFTLGKWDPNKYRKWYYEHNKKRHNFIVERARKNYQLWIASLKNGKSCCFCKENCPACLDWHHKNPRYKEFTIGGSVKKRVSKKRVIKETKKCVIICSNCHRKLHRGIIRWKDKPNSNIVAKR